MAEQNVSDAQEPTTQRLLLCQLQEQQEMLQQVMLRQGQVINLLRPY
jgi:hypothetical protein